MIAVLSTSPFGRLLPGLALSSAVAGTALLLARVETLAVGHAWIEPLVVAILLGTALRTAWALPAAFAPGIDCAARFVLEVAVMLIGATISFGTLAAAGPALLAGIVATVLSAIGLSFLVGRALGLPAKMATLVACGNAICGNSAIAAVAPVIEADGRDVATAIAFTAVLGVGVVLLLPLVAAMLHLSPTAGGALAGLTVYAVPQVLAAAGPMGGVAVQVGTLVKLVRVLMLGPVLLLLSLLAPRDGTMARGAPLDRRRLALILPWFIVGFLLLAGLRSAGLLPTAAVDVADHAAGLLTVVAMAALGLGVDLRSVAAAGPRVTAVVTLSLCLLAGIALGILWATGLAWNG
nr:putative sulfate exporter family transporter [Sphingomonas sp. Y57]